LSLYEAMFLVEPPSGDGDIKSILQHIHGILKNNGARIVQTEKWGERKLAYQIGQHKRALYILIHFNASGESIPHMRRAFTLSDTVLRHLILADDLVEEPTGDVFDEEGNFVPRPPPPEDEEPAQEEAVEQAEEGDEAAAVASEPDDEADEPEDKGGEAETDAAPG